MLLRKPRRLRRGFRVFGAGASACVIADGASYARTPGPQPPQPLKPPPSR
ncbi:hypothetical protein [Lysobacter gummosus]